MHCGLYTLHYTLSIYIYYPQADLLEGADGTTTQQRTLTPHTHDDVYTPEFSKTIPGTLNE
jgi:hypothetical protein